MLQNIQTNKLLILFQCIGFINISHNPQKIVIFTRRLIVLLKSSVYILYNFKNLNIAIKIYV